MTSERITAGPGTGAGSSCSFSFAVAAHAVTNRMNREAKKVNTSRPSSEPNTAPLGRARHAGQVEGHDLLEHLEADRAEQRGLRRAAQRGMLARQPGDHPQEDQPVGGQPEQRPRARASRMLRPALLGQPEQLQHRPRRTRTPIPVIANEPTSATPSPSSASRSNSSRLSIAGASGTWAHCSDSASRRFDIQPIPEYSAASRPTIPTVPRWLIAWSMIGLMVSARLPGHVLGDRRLQLVEQRRVEEQHVAGRRERDHHQRHQREHAEEGDRRGVVVAVPLGVAGARPDQVVQPPVAGAQLLELRLLRRVLAAARPGCRTSSASRSTAVTVLATLVPLIRSAAGTRSCRRRRPMSRRRPRAPGPRRAASTRSSSAGIVQIGLYPLAQRRSEIGDHLGQILLQVAVAAPGVGVLQLADLPVGQRGVDREQVGDARLGRRVVADLPLGVGDRRADLLGVHLRVVEQVDQAGRAGRRLAHLGARVLQVLDLGRAGRDVGLGDGEDVRPEPGVEPLREVPGELQVLALVLAHRHPVGLVEQDVGGLQHRVGEQPDGGPVGAVAAGTCP